MSAASHYSENVESFVEDSAFAKVVEDSDGFDAILIGGKVIRISPPCLAKSIVTALRRGAIVNPASTDEAEG